MSSIDKRIVQMEFDNKKFERGVAQTQKSLKDLKKGLQLDESAKSLKRLDSTGRKFDISNISKGVDTISKRFTTLGIIGVTALQNITNSAIMAGKRIVSSLTLEPVMTGLEEYEIKMNSIKTILANTEASGTTLDDVNHALKVLNDYSDNTVYNFAQMTDMVGKFAATSGELDSSVSIVKGMANLAAEAGVANTQLQSTLYQVSQAMAGSEFRLMDWRSIENAGMASKGFRDDLIKTAEAMGMFDDKAEILRQLRDETVSFGRTLEEGWLTTDVFAAVTDSYANSEAMTKAAGEVTTFSKLMVVLAESVQSGWSETWEHIIGDREQSTKLLNTLRDSFVMLTGPAADARNEMFEFWNEAGGREDVIRGLFNAMEGLITIFRPIREGFRSLFPRVTGERLVELSKRFRELSENFRVTDETASKIRRTFTGVFSIFDIFKTTIKGVVGFVVEMASAFGGLNIDIWETTGSIGDLITNFNYAYKRSEIFKKAAKTLGPYVAALGELIRSLIDAVRTLIKTIDIGPIFEVIGEAALFLSTSLKELLDNFTGFGNSKALSNVKDLSSNLEGSSERINEGVSKLSEAVSGFKTLLGEIVSNADYANVSRILKDGIFGGGLILIIRKVMKMMESGSSFVEHIKDILGGVGGALEAYQNNLKANTLIKIAGAIGILAGALMVLSTIDPNKLQASVLALSALFLNLVVAMKALTAFTTLGNAASLTLLSTSLIGISTAVLVLSGALKAISTIDTDKMAESIMSLAGVMATLVVAAKGLSTVSGKLMGTSAGLILLSVAVRLIVNSIEKLSTIDTKEMIKGIGGATAILAALVGFSRAMGSASVGIKTGVALIAIAKAVQMLSDATQDLATMDLKSLGKGLLGVAGILGAIVLFSKGVTGSASLMVTGAGMILVAKGLEIMATAIQQIGGIETGALVKGLIGMGTALGTIAVAVRAMPISTPIIAAGLLLVSSAIGKLSESLIKMGSMNLGSIGKSLIALAGALTIIGVAVRFMTGTLAGSAAILVMSVALTGLAKTLGLLGDMSLSEIGKSLLALAGAFTVLGVAGLLLTPVIPSLFALSAALLAIGGSTLMAGAGLTLISVGLKGLIEVATLAGGTIPLIFQALAESAVVYLKVLGDNAETMMNSFKKIALAMLDTIAELIPEGVKIFGELVVALLDTIAELTPKIIDAGILMVLSVIEGIEQRLPDITDAGWNLIIAFIDSMADSTEANAETLADSIGNLFQVIIKQSYKILLNSIKGFFKLGLAILDGLHEGMSDARKFVYDLLIELKDAMVEKVLKIKDDFLEAGGEIVSGLVDGIKDKAGDAVEAVQNLGGNLLQAMKDKLRIASPSKAFEIGVGHEIVNGVIVPLEASKGKVAHAANSMVDGALSAVTRTEDVLNNLVNGIFSKETVEEEGINTGKDLVESVATGGEEALPAVAEMSSKVGKTFYDKQVEWINERKFYNELSLKEELEAWQEVQAYYDEGTEERKKADKEVYTVKKEYIEKMEALDIEYRDGTMAITEELKADIKALNEEYDSAFEKRSKAIYDAFGLFEEMEDVDPVDPKVLAGNLKEQVEVIQLWRDDVNSLTERGVSEDLMDELIAMGPKAAAQIKALNSMSDPELEKYVEMWRKKHEQARYQTTWELTKMREDHAIENQKLITQAEKQYTELKTTYETKLAEIKGVSDGKATDIRTKWNEEVVGLREDNTKEFEQLQTDVKSMDWKGVGEDMIDGMRQGVVSKSGSLATAARRAAARALQAAKNEIDANSPSRKFMDLGKWSMQGFANGFKRYAGLAESASKEAGSKTIKSMRDALNKLSSITDNVDTEPTIRPVMDLSDVTRGVTAMNGMFGASSIKASMSRSKTDDIASTIGKTTDSKINPKPAVKEVNYTQNNYSPKALSRVEIYRQTKNQLGAVRI